MESAWGEEFKDSEVKEYIEKLSKLGEIFELGREFENLRFSARTAGLLFSER